MGPELCSLPTPEARGKPWWTPTRTGSPRRTKRHGPDLQGAEISWVRAKQALLARDLCDSVGSLPHGLGTPGGCQAAAAAEPGRGRRAAVAQAVPATWLGEIKGDSAHAEIRTPLKLYQPQGRTFLFSSSGISSMAQRRRRRGCHKPHGTGTFHLKWQGLWGPHTRQTLKADYMHVTWPRGGGTHIPTSLGP